MNDFTVNYQVRTVTADGASVTFRAFQNIPTVERPVEPECQVVNIFAPEEYYNGGAVNGYNAATAPVLFVVDMGGFMTARPKTPEDERFRRTSIFFYALCHGYVVVAAGCRGRMSKNSAGYTGKLPAAMVDCKAALRFIHANACAIPGDKDRIIVTGTSAGGGVAAALGLYDNDGELEEELEKLGAAKAADTVLGAALYCPVTDLDHADMAYEWQFAGIYDYHRMAMNMDEGGRPQFSKEDGVMDAERVRYSRELAALFAGYVNSLSLADRDGTALTLDDSGEGSFKEYVLAKLTAAARKAGETKTISFADHMKEITRMKTAPAFDDVTMKSFENNAFGDVNHDYAHFSDYSFANSTSADPYMAPEKCRRLANPFNYIGGGMAKYWRIRHGSVDRDIGFGTSAVMNLLLEKAGAETDYAIDWNERHGGEYDAPQLFEWIDGICGR